jgi:ATP-binding cassette subfamily B protein
MMFRIVLFAPFMGVGAIIYALRKSVSLAWVLALAVVVLICLVVTLFVAALPKFKRLQGLIDRLNRVTRENLSGIMVSRAYNAQDFEKERFDGANRELTKTNLFVNRLMGMAQPVMGLLMNGLTLLIVWFGAKLISQSALQIGDMMAYLQYAMHVVMSFMFISMIFIMLPRASVSGDRIQEVLATEPVIADPDQPVRPDSAQRGTVEFRHVGFTYPGAEAPTLHDISFTARPGETTAIIGATGSGKTTLLSLIPRIYDVSEGEVLVDGADVRTVRQHDLRGEIGYAPQKAVLFTGTVADNLRLGAPEADDARVRQAAEVAQAAGFIAAKERGFDEPIAQGGTNVSGGQRQRLSVARALTTDAQVLLFDDTFSALDFKTDAACGTPWRGRRRTRLSSSWPSASARSATRSRSSSSTRAASSAAARMKN